MQNCQWNQLMLSDLLEINTPSWQIVDFLMQSLGCRDSEPMHPACCIAAIYFTAAYYTKAMKEINRL